MARRSARRRGGRGITFVQIITYFETHPPRLETFLTECPAGRADLAIQGLPAVGAARSLLT
jgi:hypothetical protein